MEYKKAKHLIVLSLCVFFSSCSQEIKQNLIVATPKTNQLMTLNVAHAINNRFPQLSNLEIKQALFKAEKLIYKQFNSQVKFNLIRTLPLEELFSNFDDKFIHIIEQDIINVKDGVSAIEYQAIVKSIEVSLLKSKENIRQIYQFSKPYLLAPVTKLTFNTLSNALAKTLVFRLKKWFRMKSKDNRSVLLDDNYNEWVWWDNLGYTNIKYDLIVTNQLVASVEKYGMDAHSALRGGITNGTTTFSHNAKYKMYAFVTSFPIINKYKDLTLLRNQKYISKKDKTDYLAAMITHEMGHFIFHYGHPFGNEECIMSPMPLIDYKTWLTKLDAKKCYENNYQSMKKGAIKLGYNPNLIQSDTKPKQ